LSGRVDYVVVSEGGLAGVGETLRRMPWTMMAVHGEKLVTKLRADEFRRLESLPRDEWPGR
jgi:hypothetical protein